MAFQRLKAPVELSTVAGLVTIDEVDLSRDIEWVLRGINVKRVPTDVPIRWDKFGRAHFGADTRWDLDCTDEKTASLFAWLEREQSRQPAVRKKRK